MALKTQHLTQKTLVNKATDKQSLAAFAKHKNEYVAWSKKLGG